MTSQPSLMTHVKVAHRSLRIQTSEGGLSARSQRATDSKPRECCPLWLTVMQAAEADCQISGEECRAAHALGRADLDSVGR